MSKAGWQGSRVTRFDSTSTGTVERGACRSEQRAWKEGNQPRSCQTQISFCSIGSGWSWCARRWASLDGGSAELLRCKYLKGWSYARIGRELGLNQDAVTNRLRAARRALRERIGTHFDKQSNT